MRRASDSRYHLQLNRMTARLETYFFYADQRGDLPRGACRFRAPGVHQHADVRVLGEEYIKKNILPYTRLGRLIEPSEIAEAQYAKRPALHIFKAAKRGRFAYHRLSHAIRGTASESWAQLRN